MSATPPAAVTQDGTLDYRVSWPRPATPCDLVPLWRGEFRDFNDWVNFATTRLTGTTDKSGREIKSVCVDALGRRCSIGADFMRARDEDAFPVRYFWECVTRLTASPPSNGMVLVPVEPTEAMIRAGESAAWDDQNSMPTIRAMLIGYRAMIAAAPSVSTSAAEVQKPRADCNAVAPSTNGWREQGQREGFAAAVQWLRDRSATKPPTSLWSAAEILADHMEASCIPAAAPPPSTEPATEVG